MKVGRTTMKVKITTFMLMIFTIAALGGCGLIEKDTTVGKVIDGQEVVAVVNDEHVLKEDYEMQVNQVKTALEANGQNLTTAEGKKTLKDIEEKVLDSLIQDVLALQQAREQGITLEENEKEDAISQLEMFHGGKEALDSYLEQQGMDRDSFELFLEEQLIIAHFRDKLTEDISVSEQEVVDFFEENRELFKLPEKEIRASHILVETEEEALELLEEIKAGGDFEKLAAEHNSDGTKDTGGDLGFFGKGRMVEDFEKAAFATAIGQLSDVVQTDFGYHIIKVTGERDALGFDDVSGYIKENLEDKKRQDIFSEHIESWEKQSKIDRFL